MNGIASNILYDDCYSKEQCKQQQRPGLYRIEPLFGHNISRCYSPFGTRNNKARNSGEIILDDPGLKVDLESSLRGIDSTTSKCIDGNTLQDKNRQLQSFGYMNQFNNCPSFMDTTYSRLGYEEVREKSINRFSYPIVDPKQTVYYGINCMEDQCGNNRFGLNTRLQIKDSIDIFPKKEVLPKYLKKQTQENQFKYFNTSTR